MAVPQRRLANFSTLIGRNANVPWQMAKYITVPSSACKAFSYGEKTVKIAPVYPEIFDEIRRTTTSTCNAISIRQFSAETTGPIFTKFLHNIVALVSLFNRAHTRCYLIPFLNTRATKMGSLPIFCTKSFAMATSLEISKKEVQIDHLRPKSFIQRKDCEIWSSGSSDNLSRRNH